MAEQATAYLLSLPETPPEAEALEVALEELARAQKGVREPRNLFDFPPRMG